MSRTAIWPITRMKFSTMRKILDLIYQSSGALAGLCTLAVFLVVVAQVVGRELGYLVPGADNLASWFCAAAAFLAMAHTFQQGEMVQVGLLGERLSEAKRKWFEGGALCIALAFSVYVSHSATMYARVSFLTNELPQSGTLALPLWIPQSTFALGSALLALALLDNLLQLLRGAVPAYRLAAQANAEQARGGEGV
jgi:TRAP-type C4-dicarboxylate transport system permease small subunit